jgi:hypothetical protein
MFDLTDVKEISLWNKLVYFGFVNKSIELPLTFRNKVKKFMGFTYIKNTHRCANIYIKTVNGFEVEVGLSWDYWSTYVKVCDEILFDLNRFDDQELFNVINKKIMGGRLVQTTIKKHQFIKGVILK